MRVRAAILGPGFQSDGRPRGPRMKCGWGCGAKLTGRNMRAHFTICPKRPAASGEMERRRGTLKVERGHPPGRECCAVGAQAV
jgi:hypothetical protein